MCLKPKFSSLELRDLIIISVLTVGCYQSLLFRDLLDFEAKLLERTSTITEWPMFFTRMLTFKGFFYRPLSVFSYLLNYQIHGNSGFGFLLFNLCLHLVNAFLLYYLARRLLSHPLWPALFFALHPLATAGISLLYGRNYSLATFFMLIALNLFFKWESSHSLTLKRISVLIFLFLCMVTSKQSFVFFPVLLAWYYLRNLGLKDLRSLVIHPLFLFLSCGAMITIALFVNFYAIPYAATAPVSPQTFFISQLGNFDRFFLLYLFPINLSIVHELPFYKSIFLFKPLSGLIILSFILALLFHQRKKPLSLFAAFFLISLIPTNSIIPKGEVIYEWRLYPSLIFLGLFLAEASTLLIQRYGREFLFRIVFVFYLGFFIVLTLVQNYIYSDEVRCYQQVIRNYPNNYVATVRLFNQFYTRHDWEQAKRWGERTNELKPGQWWINAILQDIQMKLQQPPVVNPSSSQP